MSPNGNCLGRFRALRDVFGLPKGRVTREAWPDTVREVCARLGDELIEDVCASQEVLVCLHLLGWEHLSEAEKDLLCPAR